MERGNWAKRKRFRFLLLAAMGAVAAVVVFTGAGNPRPRQRAVASLGGPSGSQSSPTGQLASATSSAQAGDLADHHAVPSFVPAGASVAVTRDLAGGGWAELLALPGKANSNEMPADLTTWNGTFPAHPATGIELTELPRTVSMLGGFDPAIESETTQVIDGVTATVVVPLNGYGGFRIDWIASGVSYDLQEDRLDTKVEGTSGVSLSELLQMARSMA